MFCGQCGTELPDHAKFCGSCGESTGTANEPASRRRGRDRDRTNVRATRAIAVIFVGLIAVILALSLSSLDDTASDVALMASELALGGIALWLMGDSMRKGVLAKGTSLGSLGLGLIAALGTIAVSWGFVLGLMELLQIEDEPWTPTTWDVLVLVVAAPVLEEWLCRGVLWRALTPFTGFGERNVATALLFAMLHCLSGMINFPHRFVGGLVLGWLRERSNSLIPCIASHALHNALAVLLAMA